MVKEAEGGNNPSRLDVSRSSLSVSKIARSQNGSSGGLIRPVAQTYGRVARRSDPVSSYQNTREQWKHAPAVTAGGTARSLVGRIESLEGPEHKNIWKAVHPLQNSTSSSGYQVPTAKVRSESDGAHQDFRVFNRSCRSKLLSAQILTSITHTWGLAPHDSTCTGQARTREREQVRQSRAWNEVYKPPKTDRVLVSFFCAYECCRTFAVCTSDCRCMMLNAQINQRKHLVTFANSQLSRSFAKL